MRPKLFSRVDFIFRKTLEIYISHIEYHPLLFNLYCTICPAGHSVNFSSLIAK